jgi:hypothetical protein
MRRVVPPLVVTGLQLLAALLALGKPDLGQVVGFMTGGVPTPAGAVAVLQFLLWLVVLSAFAASLWLGVRRTAAAARQRRTRHLWGGAVLGAGLCVLMAGVLHHLSVPPLAMSGGSLQEASQELAR